jgi:hypothetical protein
MNAVAAPSAEAIERGREQMMLRFATGVSAAFVLGEFLRWTPTFLGAVLAATLLGNMPARPPLKVGVGLVLVMAVSALYAFMLASLLRLQPGVLSGAVALSMFLAFHLMHRGKAALPALLFLICMATIPLMVLTVPAYGGVLPTELVRGIVVAVLTVWAMFALWPRPLPPAPKAAAGAPLAPPLTTALLATAVVLPVLLAFLLFGITDALPVITATVMLVANFDIRASSKQALGMIAGNFAGGFAAMGLHLLLLTTPSLVFLGLVLFLATLWFGARIAAGGPAGGVALVACNAMLIVLGSAIASGPASFSIWVTRLFQFALAGAFALGMMVLLWHLIGHDRPASARPSKG